MVAAIRGLASTDFGTLENSYRLEDKPGGYTILLSARRGLTRRDEEVLFELRLARTNKEIAVRLGVTVTTVNEHVQQVLRKLHVHTRAEAVAIVTAEVLGRPFLSGYEPVGHTNSSGRSFRHSQAMRGPIGMFGRGPRALGCICLQSE